MRDERLSPLPERDKPRTLEYWQNQPFGSVTVNSRRDGLTSTTRASSRTLLLRKEVRCFHWTHIVVSLGAPTPPR